MRAKARDIRIDGRKLREARGKRSLAQVQQDIGVSRQLLSLYELERVTPPGDILAELCILYDLDVRQLVKPNQNNFAAVSNIT